MQDLPTGTITFVFTDVEGSTAAFESHPEQMSRALVRHDELIEQLAADHAGHLVRPRGEGDSRFLVFERAHDAVACAAAIQLALAREPWDLPSPIRVRIGMHSGEADLRQGDYYGSTVNRAARIRALAAGGQVLVSDATRQLAGDALAAPLSLRDLGRHRLKDLSRPEQLHQLCHPDLDDAFPPLRSLDAVRHNLPFQLTSFIGRDEEVRAVFKLLEEERLVTLLGMGGLGKTRLALQLGASAVERYPDGVWFVDLAPVADPELLPHAVASAMGAREEPGRSLVETIVARLGDDRVLLLFDNCEHLVEAAADLVMPLLQRTGETRILATSREVLGLSGEAIIEVPPLRTPAAGVEEPEELASNPSVRLFVERARAGRASFTVTAENAGTVATICARLDGIPLAIELAAARARHLSAEEILGGLSDRFAFLVDRGRGRPDRHRTLQATLDWSHELLGEEERILVRRMGVFAGNVGIEAVEAVCAEGLGSSAADLLGRLVDRSFVVLEQRTGSSRYRMLETVRAYALGKLRAAGEDDAIGDRLLEHLVGFAERAGPELAGPDQAVWFERIADDHENILEALASAGPGDARPARIAEAIWRFWSVRGQPGLGSAQLERALAIGGLDEPGRARMLRRLGVYAWLMRDTIRAKALSEGALALLGADGDPRERAGASLTLGNVAYYEGDATSRRVRYEQALALSREAGDRLGTAAALRTLGEVAAAEGDTERALAIHAEALEISRGLGNKRQIARSLIYLGDFDARRNDLDAASARYEEALTFLGEIGDTLFLATAHRQLGALATRRGENHVAREHYEQALAIMRKTGDKVGIAGVVWHFGALASEQHDHPTARAHFEEALDLYERIGLKDGIGASLLGLGVVSFREGRFPDARQAQQRALRMFHEVGQDQNIPYCLDNLSQLAAASGEHARAARLAGAAAALHEAYEDPLSEKDHAELDESLAPARAALGGKGFERAFEAGRALGLDEAIALALSEAATGT